MRLNNLGTAVVALFVLATSGCLSVSQQVLRKMKAKDFAEARDLILRGEGTDPELEQVRSSYSREIEIEFGITNGLAADGQLTQAKVKAEEGLRLAPWSVRLASDLAEIEQRIADLKELETRWASVAVDHPATARTFLGTVVTLNPDYRDSPELRQAAKQARQTLSDLWFEQLNGGKPDLDIQQLKNDVSLFKAPKALCLDAVGVLSAPRIERDERWMQAVRSCADAADAPGLPHAARNWVDQWVRRNVPTLVSKARVGFESIERFEQFRTSLDDWPEFDCALAELHFAHAATRAGMGLTAVLALLHAERAEELCSDKTKYAAIRATAASALSSAKLVPLHLTIDADPTIEPWIFDVVRKFIISALRASTKGHVALTFAPIGSTGGENRIYLSDIDLSLPSLDQLTRVNSAYFSHNEDVPNPRRQQLRYQLAQEKIDLDSAERAVTYAITSHNISPSEWSLQNVNHARRRYAAALDSYNTVVDNFNSTPSTISQPVYLPYNFLQGKLRSGWSVDFEYSISTARGSGVARSREEGFVRVGTHFSDRNADWRRDVMPNMDLSVPRIVAHLDATAQQILLKIGPALARAVSVPTGSRSHPEHRGCAGRST